MSKSGRCRDACVRVGSEGDGRQVTLFLNGEHQGVLDSLPCLGVTGRSPSMEASLPRAAVLSEMLLLQANAPAGLTREGQTNTVRPAAGLNPAGCSPWSPWGCACPAALPWPPEGPKALHPTAPSLDPHTLPATCPVASHSLYPPFGHGLPQECRPPLWSPSQSTPQASARTPGMGALTLCPSGRAILCPSPSSAWTWLAGPSPAHEDPAEEAARPPLCHNWWKGRGG